MKIIELAQIQQAVDLQADFNELLSVQKAAFIGFSQGLYQVPPPMQFIFSSFQSDCHIKGGALQTSKNLVIKIANSSPHGNHGVILVFSSETGELKMMLHDQGWLTTLRTALAGILVSGILPWQVANIGIIGSGELAKMLFSLLKLKYPEQNLMLYARDLEKAKVITNKVCYSVDELLKRCDLIFTATAAKTPLIQKFSPNGRQAIIALGSDDEHKRELSPELFAQSDKIIVDSQRQALTLGDIARALQAQIIDPKRLREFGKVLQEGIPADTQKLIADFSGIAAQDVAMVEFILTRMETIL